MSERSFSHKSLGGQSSTGQSVHSATSGRANSLIGYGLNNAAEAPGLAPGLFILGSVPAIIRCWLTTTFKHDTMLYVAVCSGSYASYLDLRLVHRLGYQDRVTVSQDGDRKIKLPMFLPEAIPVSTSSRASSPAPQLPSLTVDFSVVEAQNEEADSKAVQIFLGSDVLRTHNADILLSSNVITIYDDDGGKLRIPLVRPEHENTFKTLYTTSGHRIPAQTQLDLSTCASVSGKSTAFSEPDEALPADSEHKSRQASTKVEGPGNATSLEDDLSGQRNVEPSSGEQGEAKGIQEVKAASAVERLNSSPATWSNWRRDAEKVGSVDWASVGKTPAPTYQRRDTGIKVLRKPGTRAVSTSVPQAPSPSATGQSRFFGEGKRRDSTAGESLKRTVSGEKAKENMRPANPVGGASAFPWLKAGNSK